jgi:hypothetical protein
LSLVAALWLHAIVSRAAVHRADLRAARSNDLVHSRPLAQLVANRSRNALDVSSMSAADTAFRLAAIALCGPQHLSNSLAGFLAESR